MKKCGLFVDESGDGSESRHYLLTLVFHDQSISIEPAIQRYEEDLKRRGLPDIPFHASPLMNGHDSYEGMPVEYRKRLLAAFSGFARSLPVSYVTFRYRMSEVTSTENLAMKMQHDVSAFLKSHLDHVQTFDLVKVFYDDGQPGVSKALHAAIEESIAKQAVVYRGTRFQRFRLSQVADYFCAIELAAVKYAAHEQTATDERFFGGSQNFKKNWLKQARRMRLE